jgi:hypothetical protein
MWLWLQVLFQNFVRSSSVDRCAIFSAVLAIAALVLLFPGTTLSTPRIISSISSYHVAFPL